MRMSSRFILSPRSPVSPFPRVTTPSAVISPAETSLSNRGAIAKQTKSSYQTLADKLKNAHWDSKEEKQADVANESDKQPPGSLLWMKYKLIKTGVSVTVVEPGDGSFRREHQDAIEMQELAHPDGRGGLARPGSARQGGKAVTLDAVSNVLTGGELVWLIWAHCSSAYRCWAT